MPRRKQDPQKVECKRVREDEENDILGSNGTHAKIGNVPKKETEDDVKLNKIVCTINTSIIVYVLA